MSRFWMRGAVAALLAVAVVVVSAGFLATRGTDRPAEGATGAWETVAVDAGPLPTTRDGRSGFVHPGILVSAPQLDFVLGKVRAREEPWHSAWLEVVRSRYADLSWRPEPVATVECGFYSNPDRGCTREAEDAIAAYTHALLWVFTRDGRYAQKSVEILDAWSGALKRHTNSNAPLQAGWSGAMFVRAAELIRHTYQGWAPDRLARAEEMFRTAFLPLVLGELKGYRAGNWGLIMLDAAVGISVFLDDRPSFLKAVETWRLRLRSYVYLSSDGALPKASPDDTYTTQQLVRQWSGQTRFVDGLAQETCRDFLHTGWGLSAAAHVAETAWIQGLDLYAEARERLTAALELHAGFDLGEPVPSWLCGGKLTLGIHPMPEVAYNHYVTRVGQPLPRTEQVIKANRPAGPAFFYAWETLTHAANPR
ncbi:alginate lyase family protein [Micromonospora sp. NPDC126480]|uniref:alginate lyase family protein n=1 Tax=Micromonospora sp. NPDC126480 TaxID=3155312 RepID=UPI003322927A